MSNTARIELRKLWDMDSILSIFKDPVFDIFVEWDRTSSLGFCCIVYIVTDHLPKFELLHCYTLLHLYLFILKGHNQVYTFINMLTMFAFRTRETLWDLHCFISVSKMFFKFKSSCYLEIVKLSRLRFSKWVKRSSLWSCKFVNV